MEVVRFSAVEIFGVPMDSPEQINTISKLVKLMGAYSVHAQEVSAELTDITPYYWQNPAFRYYLSRKDASGPAVIDVMPRHNDSATFLIAPLERDALIGIETPERSIEIPTQQECMVIGGPGPRYGGHLCIHELIASL
jgi:hypothetical protein